MAYADAANYNRIKSMKAYPVGTIIPWSGAVDSVPSGWRVCDGSTLDAAAYTLLFETIGTTYGGTAAVTAGVASGNFRLPNLNGNGILDVYQNHFNWLNGTSGWTTRGDAHRPENTTITTAAGVVTDQFWNRVQVGGDTPTESSGNYSSDMDLVGTMVTFGISNLTADVSGISLQAGEFQRTAFIVGRKLSDTHMRNHRHGIDSGYNDQTQNLSILPKRTARIKACSDPTYHAPCSANVDCAFPSGPNALEVPGGRSDEYGVPWFLSPINYRNGTIEGYQPPSGYNGPLQVPNFVPGGGTSNGNDIRSGDGVSSGDMFSHRTFTQTYPAGYRLVSSNLASLTVNYSALNFHTSLSNQETTWTTVADHDHGTIDLDFESRISVTATYRWNDIRLGSVRINNTTGLGVAEISTFTHTPSLVMIFIIRLF